jgi:hypothetical protein
MRADFPPGPPQDSRPAEAVVERRDAALPAPLGRLVERALAWSCWGQRLGLARAGRPRHCPPRCAGLQSRSCPPTALCCLGAPPSCARLRRLRPPPPGLRRGLIPRVSGDVGHGRPETARVPPCPVSAGRSPDAGAFFGAAFPESSPRPWPSPGVHGSALSCPWPVTSTARQDSREVADGGVAPLAQRETPLQHPRSPTSTGRLRRGSSVMTTAGLAPARNR